MSVPAALRAHDLLWGLAPQHLPAGAPQWAFDALAAQAPAVVRRAFAPAGWVAVGVRGSAREQRLATLMPVSAVTRVVRPEQLCCEHTERDWPAMQALRALRSVLCQSGLVWGVAGSAGFELASGLPALHAASDLDLVAYSPDPLPRSRAAQWLAALQTPLCRVDLQVQTPCGAVALAEWAGASHRVLLKREDGARLVVDPWRACEQAA